MITFKYPSGHIGHLIVKHANEEIGTVMYDVGLSLGRLSKVLNMLEIKELEKYDNMSESLTLMFVTIREPYLRKGHFSEVVKEFLDTAKSMQYSSVYTLVEKDYVEFFNKMGFEKVYELESIKLNLMKRGL